MASNEYEMKLSLDDRIRRRTRLAAEYGQPKQDFGDDRFSPLGSYFPRTIGPADNSYPPKPLVVDADTRRD